jgi:hypothetical protein
MPFFVFACESHLWKLVQRASQALLASWASQASPMRLHGSVLQGLQTLPS